MRVWMEESKKTPHEEVRIAYKDFSFLVAAQDSTSM